MIPTPLRIWRSHASNFGALLKDEDDRQHETVTAAAAYTDEILAGIRAAGFNAIWIHGILQEIVRTKIFPGLAPHAAVHLRELRRLVDRAAGHDLKVCLYMQPPRGIRVEHPFWKKHPHLAGPVDRRLSDDGHPVAHYALCPSTDEVRAFLEEAPRQLFTRLPELGGLILITASEYPSHCHSRTRSAARFADDPDVGREADDCPRCRDRSPVEVVTEIVQRVRHGVRQASPGARVIAWNWSWTSFEDEPSPSIIRGLPKDVVLLCDFERGGTKTILGKPREINEYALSYIGPSPSCRDAIRVARRAGLEVMTKLQVGTTHELATVPNLPLIGSLYDKAKAMRKLGVGGYLGTWNFGNMPSANTAAFNRFFLASRLPPKTSALRDFARAYFPGCRPELVVDAWDIFADAMDSYPCSQEFLYMGATNYALAFPLKPAPVGRRGTGRSWLMDPRGDNFRIGPHWNALGGFTEAELVRGLSRLARRWRQGARRLQQGLHACDATTAREEIDNAWVCYHVFRSTWNVYRVYRLRARWTPDKRPAYLAIARNELRNLEQVLPILRRDPRFGLHLEARAYMFTAEMVEKKIAALKRQLRKG